jgi:hypothetical protein
MKISEAAGPKFLKSTIKKCKKLKYCWLAMYSPIITNYRSSIPQAVTIYHQILNKTRRAGG